MTQRKPNATGTTDTNHAVIVPISQPAVLTVAQVADRLQIPVSSVYEKTRYRAGNVPPLPCRKVGRYLRFFASEVDLWLVSLPQVSRTTKRKYHRKVA
jgi:hypothetical protein